MTRNEFFWICVCSVAGLPAASQEAPDGTVLYAEYCAACHGAELEGQPDWRGRNPDGTLRAPPHDDSGHTWHHGDTLLTDYVRLGGAEALAIRGIQDFQSGMPAFGDVLTDEEIAAILTFIKAHWSEQSRGFQATATEAEQGSKQ